MVAQGCHQANEAATRPRVLLAEGEEVVSKEVVIVVEFVLV